MTYLKDMLSTKKAAWDLMVKMYQQEGARFTPSSHWFQHTKHFTPEMYEQVFEKIGAILKTHDELTAVKHGLFS